MEQPSDEMKTSITRAIASGQARMDLAQAATDIGAGKLHRRAHQPNYSPSGVFGDARLASAEKGRVWLNALLQDVCEDVRAMF